MEQEPAPHIIRQIDSVHAVTGRDDIGVRFTTGTDLQITVTFTREAAQALLQGLVAAINPQG